MIRFAIVALIAALGLTSVALAAPKQTDFAAEVNARIDRLMRERLPKLLEQAKLDRLLRDAQAKR